MKCCGEKLQADCIQTQCPKCGKIYVWDSAKLAEAEQNEREGKEDEKSRGYIH